MTGWREWRSRCRRMALKSVVSCKTSKPGEAVEGATVLVFAADSQKRGAQSRFAKTAQTDQGGRFSLEGLVPAEYRVCALTDHEPGRESELEYLSSLERDSERIDLSPGQTRGGILGGVAGAESVLITIHGPSCGSAKCSTARGGTL